MSARVTVDAAMLVSAVRYALPRLSYMPALTVDEVIRVWPELPENERMVIERDVRDALSDPPSLIPPDTESWTRLLRFIEYRRGGEELQ